MRKLAIILLGLLPKLTCADELVPPTDAATVLDAPHAYLAQQFVTLVSDIDRFFGDERNYQEGNQSVLQLDLHKVSGYAGDKQVVLAGRAKVSLPNTEKRLHLLIESNPDKNTSGATPSTQNTAIKDVSAPGSYAAAVRFEKSREDIWHLNTDAGVKFQGLNSSPFVRARASYAMPVEQWRTKFTETAFWFNSTGIGETTQLDFERSLSEPTLLRVSSNATWLHDKQNLDMRQDVSVFHTLDARTALLYQASAIGASQPQFHASDYVFLVLYRYRLHQKWMYFEVSPQLHYPQIKNYQASPALTLRLEVLFDREK